MGEWERAGGTRLGRTLIEVRGQVSIDSPGRKPIRGSGALAVMTEMSDGIGFVHWIVRTGMFSSATEGRILGNFIYGHRLERGVLVIRYADHGAPAGQQVELQLAFKGPDVGRLAEAVTVVEAAWKSLMDERSASEAARLADDEHDARPLDDDELAAINKHMGADGSVELWSEAVPDGDLNECLFHFAMAMQNSPCMRGSATYYLAGLHRRDHPDTTEDDDWDRVQQNYIVCARCVRRTLATTVGP